MTSTMPTQTIAPARTWSAVLFDLDGTIVDSASDITASLAHMFTELGLDVPSDDVLRSYVGPPLLDSLRLTAGFDDEELSTKADVVAEALRRLQAKGIDTENAVMVGDRGYDTLGALANGVPTILVEWGYGSPAEAGDAMAVVHSTDQLRNLLLG